MSTADAAVDGWRLPPTQDQAADSADAVNPADALDAVDAAAPLATGDVVDERDVGDAAEELARIRGEIEAMDRRIVALIAERVALARRVGPLKQALGMPILDPPREASIVRRAGALARDAGLPDEDVRYVFWHLVGLSRRVQLEGEGA